MNPSQQRELFLKTMEEAWELMNNPKVSVRTPHKFVNAMLDIQENRKRELGKHTWRTHLDRYGPAPYAWELIGITSRLEAAIINRHPETSMNTPKVLDLLVDLGNYASFLYDWIVEKEEQEQLRELERKLP